MIHLVIPGNPLAKARARTFQRGCKIITWDPQWQTKESVKNELEAQIRQKIGGAVPLPYFTKNRAVEVHFCFFMPYPKDLNRWIESYHKKTPDASNCVKFYEDALNGIAFADDSQIVSLLAHKIYSENPRTEIMIMEIKDDIIDPDINKILLNFSKEDVQKLHALTSVLHQKTANFNFNDDPQAWAQTTSSLIKEIADKFAQKLAKIKRIGNSRNREAGD